MNQAQFDERNWESWYFGLISHQEVDDLLKNEQVGTFLLRASSSVPNTIIISVKEKTEVSSYQVKTTEQNGRKVYKIRDDSFFDDMPSLLSFYKRNLFKSTSLVKPVSDVTKRNNPSGGSDALIQRYSENPLVAATGSRNANVRISAPADCRMRHSREEGLPLYVKVVKPRVPSPYEPKALKLNVGDVIRVLRRSRDQWEGELNGERGSFPFTYVEFVEPPTNGDQGPS